MSYLSLNNKLQLVQDDLYMQKVLKEFLGFAFEIPVCADREIATDSRQRGDISDEGRSEVNIHKNSLF